MTRCWQVFVLPRPSFAVQITMFVPTGNCAGALLVTVTEPQLSAATGLLRLTPVATQPVFAETITSGGQAIVGAVRSRTMTRWMQKFVLPLASVATQVTKFVPSGKLAADDGWTTRK